MKGKGRIFALIVLVALAIMLMGFGLQQGESKKIFLKAKRL